MLDGWELLIIGVVAIVIIMWGPSKIPEFAKALGRAKGEFSKAQKEFSEAASSSISPPASTTTTVTVPPIQAPPAQALKSRDEMLIDTARNLGISTEGKTREQLSDEINAKVRVLGSSA